MQNTILNEIAISGIGMHSGKEVILKLKPGIVNQGIIFKILPQEYEIKATFNNVHSTNMSTKLSNENCSIDLVEHFMAALYGIGIDNLTAIIDSVELPILDGSAQCWIASIKEAGIRSQGVQRKSLNVLQSIEIIEDDKYVKVTPHSHLVIDLSIDFPHSAIGQQRLIFDSKKNSFEIEIGAARTFGFIKDLEYLHSKGLGLGASLQNCIGLDENGILNQGELRFKDEFVRHKILDCLGDLFLSGYHMNCYIRAHKTGHQLNNMVLRKIFENEANYSIS